MNPPDILLLCLIGIVVGIIIGIVLAIGWAVSMRDHDEYHDGPD